MTENVKNIIADYTKIPVSQLKSDTLIGRSVVGNSIVLHRMYAAIAKEGIDVPGYQEITTYGDLLNKMGGTANAEGIVSYKEEVIKGEHNSIVGSLTGIGIDIEDISKMPLAVDFREDTFYIMNFSSREISYCIVQPDPYASFAGLFAAKEAIVKADNKYKIINYNTIHINHLPEGKPVFNGFNISISHAQNFAIAVAVKNMDHSNTGLDLPSLLRRGVGVTSNNQSVKNNFSILLSILAFILAITAFCISYLLLKNKP